MRKIQFCLKYEKALIKDVMVCGAFTERSKSPLVFYKCAGLHTHVLKPFAIPYLRQLENSIFQQNNVKLFTETVTIMFLRDSQVTLFPWPGTDPDISLIPSWLYNGFEVSDS